MSFAPDFGLRLMRDGWSRDTDIYLVPFVLYHIAVVNEGLFTTTSNIVLDGVPHAVSLDFDVAMLKAIHEVCPPGAAKLIEHELRENLFEGYMLELPEPVELVVTARLGELQAAAKEQYVPLVARRVSKLGS